MTLTVIGAGALVGRVLPVLFYGGAAVGGVAATVRRSAQASTSRQVVGAPLTVGGPGRSAHPGVAP